MLSDFTGMIEAGSREERLLRRLPGNDCRVTLRSSWMATGVGPRKGPSRELPDIAPALRPCAPQLIPARDWVSGALTLYAFSTENWKRPRYEIDALMRMLRRYLRLELDEIDRQNIRFQTIGRTGALSKSVRSEIEKATERTAKNTGMTLAVALNYGGRAEIVDATRAAVRRLIDEGNAPDELTEERIANELYTRTMPDLDLLVRTSGEMRISNFLLWQAAYSEIYVTDVLWPDFRRVHLLEAIVDYQRRDRRFGGLKLVANE